MVSLFRRSQDDTNAVAQLLMRRLDFMEYDRLVSFESILQENDNRVDNLQHRVNVLEAFMQRTNNNVESTEVAVPSLTAGLAEGARLWTEAGDQAPLPAPSTPQASAPPLAIHEGNRLAQLVSLTEPSQQYGSGAPSGAPAGQSTDLLTFTPPLTPRSPSTSQPQPQHEPDPPEPLMGKTLPRVPVEGCRPRTRTRSSQGAHGYSWRPRRESQ